MARRLDLHPWDDLPGTAERGDGWTLVRGNTVETLEKLPPRSVDLIFADPPYHLSNGGTTCQSGRRVRVDKGAWDASRGVENDHAFQRTWLSACRRVLKPSGTIWVSGTQHVIFSVGYAMQELGFHLLNTVTWYKPNAAPNLACRFFTHSTEILLWAAPMRSKPLLHRFNYRDMKARNGGKQMRDLWEISDRPAPGGEQVVWALPTPGPREKAHGRHPTQKPLSLLERVVAASSSAGDLVLDPFCGSGTTGVAATLSGRRFLGVDIDHSYVDLAARRLRAAAVELPLLRSAAL
ncbi:MAG TPA: site-specific DNA-methyltransferase [Anaeromyxobacteraceae bacterium]|nr:site-specific DNA-methyltransferase [Anaeromyxobacteraceae bacterium]